MHKRMQEIVKSRMNFHDSSKTKKENAIKLAFSFFCDRDRIQTCNRLIRSQLLYSVELRGHYFVIASAKVALSLISASLFYIFFLLIEHLRVKYQITNIQAEVKIFCRIAVSVCIQADAGEG